MTPLEKAAKAAFNADENRAGEYDHRSERVKDNYRTITRAVLLAIRELSEGMMAAGDEWTNHHADCVQSIFQAMIDKALEEG